MALSNYTELKASIADYLNRNDLTTAIPDFISLTEAKLKRRYKDFSPLSVSNASNWILASYPDVYLYGALLEASPYLVEDERVAVWSQLYATALGTLRGAVNNADFDDYDGLKLAVGDWLARADLDGVVPQLIKLAEAQINRDIRHYEMENRATAQLDGQYLDRPSDWLETIRLNITSGGTRTLDLLSAASMSDKRAGAENTTGEPKFYRHAERAFEVFPSPDGTYEVELLYYQKVPALSNGNPTNWLLTDHPDIYLYGALMHSAPYLAEDNRVGVWVQLYSAARDRINQSGEDASFSGSGLTLKVRGLG